MFSNNHICCPGATGSTPFMKKTGDRRKQQNNEDLLSLLTIQKEAKKNKKSTYTALKEMGYIKNPLEEFVI